MFKKILSVSMTSICLLFSSCFGMDISMPEEFTVNERWLSLTITFDIKTKDQMLATVHRSLMSLTPEYCLYDPQDKLLATAKMRFFRSFTVFDIKDYHSKSLGMIKEEFTWLFPTFTIISPDFNILGEAVMNFWATKFIISDPRDGHVIAVLSRPFLRLKSNWSIKIEDMNAISKKTIHPHLLMTLAAFQVDRDHWNAYSRSVKEHESNNLFDKFSQSMQTSMGSLSSSIIQKEECHDLHAIETIRTYFQKKLESYRANFEGKQVHEKDFHFIESLELSSDSSPTNYHTISKLQETFTYLFDLFESDQMEDSQKAALFLMLESKLS